MEYEPSGLDFVVTGGTGSVEERTILTSESANRLGKYFTGDSEDTGRISFKSF